MGRSKTRKEAAQEQVFAHERGENGEDEEGEGIKGAGFYSCYLLTSLCPRFKGHTYIGFTVNPKRRIRQHNGEIGSGAWRTKKRRPWEMVLCIYGFPTNVSALQFEWAWQHPVESLAVRAAAARFKSLSGLANKIKLAYTMLSLPPWQRYSIWFFLWYKGSEAVVAIATMTSPFLGLSVFFSLNIRVNLFSTKYQIHTSCCPALPEQMRAQICSMDELPCYSLHGCGDELLDDDECEVNFDKLSGECSSQEEARKLQDSPKKDGNSVENVHQQTNHNGDARVETTACLRRTSVSCATSYILKEMERPGWAELPTQSTNAPVAPKEQIFINSPDITCHEVEIIDILTPSPCYHVKLGSKRRRASLCREIIDLTNSPVFM